MPYARNARRPRMRRNRRRVARRGRPTNRRTTNFNTRNMLKPSVYPFTRQYEEMLVLESPSGNFQNTAIDNLVVGQVAIALSSLPDYTDFTTLFQAYKLNALTLRVTPSYQLDADATTGETIICDIWINPYGIAPGLGFTLNDLLQIQKRQSFIMPQRKSFTRSMKLNQLSETYGSSTNTDYSKQRPKYLSTSEASTPHYGLSFCFRRPDGAAMTSVSPRLLLNYTAKLTCKQVA